MTNPARTWTISINNAFTNQTDRVLQYQEAIFNWKTNMVAAGWTVTLSSNGDVGANTPGGGASGAADNWTTAAVLGVDDTAGGGSWIVMQAPAAFLQVGEALYVIGIVNDATANPGTFQVRMSPTAYAGGSTTTLPTSVGPETVLIAAGDSIITWGAAIPGRFATWRSTRGDTMFMVKEQGTNEIESIIMLYSMSETSGGGQGSYRVVLWQQAAGGNFQSPNILGANARSLNSSATLANSSTDGAYVLQNVSADDLDHNNEIIITPLFAVVDVAGRVRNLGQMVDLYVAPNSGVVATIFGRLIDDETAQTQRRVALGQLYVYAPTADLPFL